MLEGRRAARWFAWLAFLPVVAFCALSRPAWALLHFEPPFSLPSAVLLLAAMGSALLVPLGHAWAAQLGETSPRARWLVAVLPASLALMVVVLLRHRSLVLTRARGNAPAEELFGSAWGAAVLALDVLLGVALWLTASHLSTQETPSAASGPAFAGHRRKEHGSNG